MAERRLVELGGVFVTTAGTGRKGLGVEFTCPHCAACVDSGVLPEDEAVRFVVPFVNPIDGREAMEASEHWERVGESLDSLSLMEPVRVLDHGTIQVLAGGVDWDPWVHRPPVAFPLTDLDPIYVDAPGRTGVGIMFTCPHCDDRLGLAFENPLDGRPRANGAATYFRRSGGRDPKTAALTFDDLTIEQRVVLDGHADFAVRNGYVIEEGE